MKLILTAISGIFLLLAFQFCEVPSHEMSSNWKLKGASANLSLLDSVPLPKDFPQHLLLSYCTGSDLIYSYFAVVENGSVEDIRLGILNLQTGVIKSLSTGTDRTGQKRSIAAIHVSDGLIYTLDDNAQIISYNFDLEQKQSVVLKYPPGKIMVKGDFIFKNDDDFITTVWANSSNVDYSPLVKVEKNGKVKHLHKALKIEYINNQMKDYPDMLGAVYKNQIVVIPQHQRGFFIAGLDDDRFFRYNLPAEIPVDEKPALNQVLNMQGEVAEKYVKNAAFKWCSFDKGKIHLIFHQRPKTNGKAPRYQLYSLNVETKEVSVIDSLPFEKPHFVNSTEGGALYVLENSVLYKYLF